MSQAIFLRALEPDTEEKGGYLVGRIKAVRAAEAEPDDIFVRDPERFAVIPKSPFAYWVSERIRQIFKEFPPLEGNAGTVKQGLATADDFRFVRAWWEVDPERIGYSAEDSEQGKGWIHFAKGGSYSPYYADVHLVVNWFGRGAQIKNYYKPGGRLASRPQNEDYYFRPGLTWPHRTHRLSPAVLPHGLIFSHTAKSAFPSQDMSPYSLAAVMSSRIFNYLLGAQLERTEHSRYEVGPIQATPVPISPLLSALEEPSRRLTSLFREACEVNETDRSFTGPAATAARDGSTSGPAPLAAKTLISEMEQASSRLYGLSSDSRNEVDVIPDILEMEHHDPDKVVGIARLCSYCTGVSLGRWDIRAEENPELICDPPDPLDRIPALPRVALVDQQGFPPSRRHMIASEPWLRARRNSLHLPTPDEVDGPISVTAADYSIDIAWDGILVDDPGHPKDIIRKVREVLRHLYNDRAQEIEEEAVKILQGEGRTPRTLRDWFRNQKATDLAASFFDFHIKRYSKSRRKAPIYWRLCTSPGRGQSSYGIWLYYHRLTDDTLWKVLREYVTPRRELEERRLEEARRKLSAAESSEARKLEGEVQERAEFLEEIGWFEEEIRRVAQSGWAPNRDDGVIINLAPLHKLVPWSEPEQVWKKLAAGEYDWTHLAMRHWPKRVEERCRSDKSLAMAHDRLDLYEGEQ